MSELRADYLGYPVTCERCKFTKKPVGRSEPFGIFCDSDCRGYWENPQPSHLWPNESEADFGYKVPR